MEKRKIGIIAGSGELPEEIAKNAKKEGNSVFVAGWKGVTKAKSLKKVSDEISIYPFGEVSGIIDFFKKNDVKEVFIVGKVNPENLWRINPFDRRVLSILKEIKERSPLNILKKFGEVLEKEGLKVMDTTIFLKESLPEEGIFSGNPDSETIDLLRSSFESAKRIAELDIGQSIAVKEGMVVAVEAIEGTDNMIKRAGKYTRGGFFVVKVSRPSQDPRYDVPVLGLKTLRKIKKYNGIGLVFEAKRTIFLNFEESVDFSKKNNLFLVGL